MKHNTFKRNKKGIASRLPFQFLILVFVIIAGSTIAAYTIYVLPYSTQKRTIELTTIAEEEVHITNTLVALLQARDPRGTTFAELIGMSEEGGQGAKHILGDVLIVEDNERPDMDNPSCTLENSIRCVTWRQICQDWGMKCAYGVNASGNVKVCNPSEPGDRGYRIVCSTADVSERRGSIGKNASETCSDAGKNCLFATRRVDPGVVVSCLNTTTLSTDWDVLCTDAPTTTLSHNNYVIPWKDQCGDIGTSCIAGVNQNQPLGRIGSARGCQNPNDESRDTPGWDIICIQPDDVAFIRAKDYTEIQLTRYLERVFNEGPFDLKVQVDGASTDLFSERITQGGTAVAPAFEATQTVRSNDKNIDVTLTLWGDSLFKKMGEVEWEANLESCDKNDDGSCKSTQSIVFDEPIYNVTEVKMCATRGWKSGCSDSLSARNVDVKFQVYNPSGSLVFEDTSLDYLRHDSKYSRCVTKKTTKISIGEVKTTLSSEFSDAKKCLHLNDVRVSAIQEVEYEYT